MNFKRFKDAILDLNLLRNVGEYYKSAYTLCRDGVRSLSKRWPLEANIALAVGFCALNLIPFAAIPQACRKWSAFPVKKLWRQRFDQQKKSSRWLYTYEPKKPL